MMLAEWMVVAAWGAVMVGGQSPGEAVRDVFREMLHITPPEDQRGSGLPSAPKHMVELYQQFVTRQPDWGSGTTTVRNFLPSTGGKELLLFNVSSVGSDEEVRLAQLQLNRRRLHQRHRHRRLLAPPYRVRLYLFTPGGRLAPLGSVPVSMVLKSAWASVDITAPFRELLLDPRTVPSGNCLAVRFESPTGKIIPPSHFLRGLPDNSYAFLVVFSEDGEDEVTEDGGRPPPKPPVHTHAIVQRLRGGGLDGLSAEQDNTPEMIPHLPTKKERRLFIRNVTMSDKRLNPTPTTSGDFSEKIPSNAVPSSENSEVRRTRSIVDNRLPGDDDDITSHMVLRSSPETLLNVKTNMLAADTPYKKPKKIKKGKRRRGKNKKFSSAQDSIQKGAEDGQVDGAGCAVRKMTVNFAEIGWGEWIISPDKFDANYCSGSCRFPLTEEKDLKVTEALKPSNHATLQSLVHALGHDPGVPAPSCVPLTLSPVTLLYFDHTLNVVLKNYPSMIVESCACR